MTGTPGWNSAAGGRSGRAPARFGRMDLRHVERLRRARDLLAVKGFDTRDTVLACYSGAGFDRELEAAGRSGIRLIGLDQLYADQRPPGQAGGGTGAGNHGSFGKNILWSERSVALRRSAQRSSPAWRRV